MDEDLDKTTLLEELRRLRLQNENYRNKTQKTTLKELLQESYNNIEARFAVETDLEMCTKGSVTSPEGKLCPKRLVLWQGFPQLQADAFDQALLTFHPPDTEPRRDFMSIQGIEETGACWHRGSIKSEEDLKLWQTRNVEDFVIQILRILFGNGSFENQAHVLGVDANGKLRQPTNADQLCIIQLDGINQVLAVIEYKATHKLTAAHLRASIRDTAVIDVDQIRNWDPRSSDDRTSYDAHARYLLAATTCQTYNYLIKSGCLYGCIMTGEAIVFLKVDEENPTDLLYFVAEPRLNAKSGPEEDLDISKTSIAQLTSFCVMAHPPNPMNQEWARRATDLAPLWIKDVVDTTPQKLREIEKELDDRMEKLDLDYQGFGGPHVARSPYLTRQRTKAKSSGACVTELKTSGMVKKDSSDESSDDAYLPDTPSKSGAPKCQQGQIKQQSKYVANSGQTKGAGGKNKGQQRQYCSQACLFGLVHRLPIDEACPNASSHPRSENGNTHAVTRPKLGQMLRQQLHKTMDVGCDNLWLRGSRGMLFRLSLASYGYTLVGKGTISMYIRDLKREGRRYRRLHQFQGQSIPVYLGNIDLDIPWYGLGIDIIHMLLLSYGGEALKGHPTHEQVLQAHDFERAIGALGIRHRDMRFPNMLWNQELQRLLFIDFERSIMIPVDREPITPIAAPPIIPKDVSPKRKALQELSPAHSKFNQFLVNVPKSQTPEHKVAEDRLIVSYKGEAANHLASETSDTKA